MAGLNEIYEVLKDIRERVKIYYPAPTDSDQSLHSTFSIAPNAVTTILVTVPPEYTSVLKRAYMDALPNCAYEWTIQSEVFDGNDLKFSRPFLLEHPQQFILKVTSTNPVAQTGDFVIDAYGVPKMG